MQNTFSEFTESDLVQESATTDLYLNDHDNIAFIGKYFSGCSTGEGVKLICHEKSVVRAYRVLGNVETELDNNCDYLELWDFENTINKWEEMARLMGDNSDKDVIYKNEKVIDYMNIKNKNEWHLIYKDDKSIFVENYDQYGVDRVIIYDVNKFFTQIHEILRFGQEVYHKFQ
jgi:hypothetical protein